MSTVIKKLIFSEMVDDLELIEKRIAHLESLVGKFDKIDNTKVCC